jgi:hypothetical protein
MQGKITYASHTNEGMTSRRSMIKIQNDVGRVLEWEAAEGEERHHDLITGKYQYATRLKQAWIGWKI